jgi:hypothetical protein
MRIRGSILLSSEAAPQTLVASTIISVSQDYPGQTRLSVVSEMDEGRIEPHHSSMLKNHQMRPGCIMQCLFLSK